MFHGSRILCDVAAINDASNFRASGDSRITGLNENLQHVACFQAKEISASCLEIRCSSLDLLHYHPHVLVAALQKMVFEDRIRSEHLVGRVND